MLLIILLVVLLVLALSANGFGYIGHPAGWLLPVVLLVIILWLLFGNDNSNLDEDVKWLQSTLILHI